MDYFTDRILTAAGWRNGVRVQVDETGTVAALEPGASPQGCKRIRGTVLPAMTNLHCHAFQRAMAGRTEVALAGKNDFWAWRDAMYSLANSLDPERLHAVAAQVYMEMLKRGYTWVAEFHYIHHGLNGAPPEAMARALTEAAADTGIGLTLVPVLYRSSDFGGAPTLPEQRCFMLSPDGYLELLQALSPAQGRRFRLGIGLHSLRAVPADDLHAVLEPARRLLPEAPVHIHAAEQQAEVDRCILHYGSRPVEWLLENVELDEAWCLVHATHMTPDETRGLAQRGCTAGLCPTTEADLGDGLFPLAAYLDAGGLWGIGSDSNVCMDPFQELQLLEYGQRLLRRHRNIAVDTATAHNGAFLWRGALAGGARACGLPAGGIALGNRADWIVVDDNHPGLFDKHEDFVLDALIFGGHTDTVLAVYAGGRKVVEDGRHLHESEINQRFMAEQKGFWEAH